MATSNYPFLARNQKTEEDRQKDNIDALWKQMGIIGVNNNNNSYFTGYGEDNQLQPNRPTGILNTNQGPRTVHEGERLDVAQNGEFSVTPASQIGGQGNLQDIEQRFGMQGYQFGTSPFGSERNVSTRQFGTAPKPTAEPTQMTVAPVASTMPKREPMQLAPSTTQQTTPIEPVQSTLPERTPMTTSPVQSTIPTTTTQAQPATPTVTDRYEPYTTSGIQRLERYADFESPREAAMRAGERERFAGEAASARGALSQEMAQYGITGREAATESAMLGRQIGAQESQLMADLRRQEGERAFAAARQLPGEALAARAFDFERQKYGDQEFARMANAAQTTSLETWKQMFPNATDEDYNRAREYKTRELQSMDIANEAARLGVDSNRLQAAVNAANTGADLAAANQASGLNLSQEQYDAIRRNYTYEGQVQQLAVSDLTGKVGDQRVNSIMNMINAGASMDRINQYFPEANLSMEEFKNLRATTTTGQREWERNLSAANMLLQTMSPENISNAEGMLNEIFPGATFEFDQLIQDVGADRFAQSMTDLATLASTFSTWEDAEKSAEGLGIINNLGMTKEQSRELFDGLQLNTIDEEWRVITESDRYKALPDDSKKLIDDIFTASLTGELEFDITPSYEVVDNEGRLVKAFDSIADAEKHLAENPNKNYSINEEMNFNWKDMLSGDSVVVNNEGDVVSVGEVEKEEPTQKLDEFQIEEYSELLFRPESKALFETFDDNPQAIRDSEYYYKMPTTDWLRENSTQKFDANKKVSSTVVSDEFKSNFDNNIGKFIEVPYGDEIVEGQLVSYSATPNTVQIKVKLEDGTYRNVPIINHGTNEIYGKIYEGKQEEISSPEGTQIDYVDVGGARGIA